MPVSRIDLEVREQYAPTSDGWSLHLRRTRLPGCFDPATKPLLIVPGYGMNSFIFSYHPRNTSMERCLAEAGFEVWSVNLRGQGPSRCDDKDAPARLLLKKPKKHLNPNFFLQKNAPPPKNPLYLQQLSAILI